MSGKLSNEIASFLESFTSLVSLTDRDNLELSLDDIYYLEYCKVKAENFIEEIESNQGNIGNEISLYVSNLKVVIKQINMIEKLIDTSKHRSKNEIDKKVTEYIHSVRKPENIVYAQAFATYRRDIFGVYDTITNLSILPYVGLGIYLSDWTSVKSVTQVFTMLAIINLGVLGITGKIVEQATGNISFKKSYVNKQQFISKVISKVVIATDRREYYYLSDLIKKMEINDNNIFKVCYVMSKIEALGEYVNKNSKQLEKFEFSREVEKKMKDIHLKIKEVT